MKREEIRGTVLSVLGKIAPEAELASVPESAPLREELEIDSMDFLNFTIGLHDAFGVDIPEADLEQLSSLRGCVDYLAARLDAR
jgi:acyl carrier protein